MLGCGPQETFRACADISIKNSDGSADNTPNTLVDPEIYVPKKTLDIGTDDDKYNEIDVDRKDGYLQSGTQAMVFSKYLLQKYITLNILFYLNWVCLTFQINYRRGS